MLVKMRLPLMGTETLNLGAGTFPMSDLPFAHEKLLAALAEIAISNDSLQDRLFKAFTGPLAMLEPHRLPEQICKQYEEVLPEGLAGKWRNPRTAYSESIRCGHCRGICGGPPNRQPGRRLELAYLIGRFAAHKETALGRKRFP
jgi:hypothetical protein